MLVLGHRGASATFPENTLSAFRGALDQGADGVELDVRRTADGGLAVRHDAELPDGRRIVEVAARDLPPEIPVLDQVLDASRRRPLVNIEIKNWPDDVDFDADETLAEGVVALLDGPGPAGRRPPPGHLVPPPDDRPGPRPRAGAGHGLAGHRRPGPGRARGPDGRAGPPRPPPPPRVRDPQLVEVAHAAGLALNTWTVDDPDRIRWLAGLGVDAVIVNDPAAALAALGR